MDNLRVHKHDALLIRVRILFAINREHKVAALPPGRAHLVVVIAPIRERQPSVELPSGLVIDIFPGIGHVAQFPIEHSSPFSRGDPRL